MPFHGWKQANSGPIESMEEARDWERLFIGEIKAGRDPRISPAVKLASADLSTRRVSRYLTSNDT